jgi:ferredoxin-NADP reductase
LGVRTFYSVTDPYKLPANWPGKVGRLTPQWIAQVVPGFGDAIFYLSGPVAMIHDFTDTLRQLGIPDTHIKVDYFSGLI